MLHLVFKVSSTCSHTRLKSLSPISNCFINYALIKLVPFLSNPASLIQCVWLQAEDTLNTRCNIIHLWHFVSEFYDPTLWNRPTAVLFSGHWLFCWVQCVLCATFCSCNYITPYKQHLWNMQLQTTSPESKFANKYSDVIFIQIDQHLKKLLQKYEGAPILWITVYFCCGSRTTAASYY